MEPSLTVDIDKKKVTPTIGTTATFSAEVSYHPVGLVQDVNYAWWTCIRDEADHFGYLPGLNKNLNLSLTYVGHTGITINVYVTFTYCKGAVGDPKGTWVRDELHFGAGANYDSTWTWSSADKQTFSWPPATKKQE